MESIVDVLVRRDGMSVYEATALVEEAKAELQVLVAEGDLEAAENICEDWFGLEPDYLMDLM
jgi:hypothetical protein